MAVIRSLRESYCLKCKRMHDIEEFHKSLHPFHANGVLPYCKTSCEDILKHYIKQTGNLESGLWITCATMGLPFVRRAYDNFENVNKGRKTTNNTRFFGQYLGQLISISPKKEGVVNPYSDFLATDVPLGEMLSIRKSEEALRGELYHLEMVWGKDKGIEQIQYLEYRYTVYTEDKVLTEYQEAQYRNLCLAELDIYEGQDVDKAVKRQTEIAKILGIDQFKIDKEKSLLEKTLEYRIAVMEENEPAIFYKDLEKYADFEGIGNYWQNHIIRPIKNVLLNLKEYKIISEKDDKAI